MREFRLINLASQMPYLPYFMQTWSSDHLIAWLKVYGEVRNLADWYHEQARIHPEHWFYRDPSQFDHTYHFQSWWGLDTVFILENGRMYIPGRGIEAWRGANISYRTTTETGGEYAESGTIF